MGGTLIPTHPTPGSGCLIYLLNLLTCSLKFWDLLNLLNIRSYGGMYADHEFGLETWGGYLLTLLYWIDYYGNFDGKQVSKHGMHKELEVLWENP